ncbi:MAG: hypothetical protein ACAI44_27325 [Candidatus Sericytochromatia bacterium]
MTCWFKSLVSAGLGAALLFPFAPALAQTTVIVKINPPVVQVKPQIQPTQVVKVVRTPVIRHPRAQKVVRLVSPSPVIRIAQSRTVRHPTVKPVPFGQRK